MERQPRVLQPRGPVLLTASQWCTQASIASAAVYSRPTWGSAEAPPLPCCAEPPSPPDSTCGAGYWIAFSFGVKDFNRAGGFTCRP